MMMLLNILLCVALVFLALSLVCAVTIGRPRAVAVDPHAWPFGDVSPVQPRSRDEVVRIARASFQSNNSCRSTGGLMAGAADGGRSVPTEVPAIRSFRMIKGGRDV